ILTSAFPYTTLFRSLSSKDGLIFPEAFEPETVKFLSSMYHLIEVGEREQFSMGTNVLSIGQNRVLSLPVNRDVNYQMRQHGYEVDRKSTRLNSSHVK